MSYKITDWKLLNYKAEEPGYVKPEEGIRWLRIESAEYNDENCQYRVGLHDLTNDAHFSQVYFTKFADKNGNPRDNGLAFKTLKTLADALFYGEGIDVPYPDDIVGGVVRGKVQMEAKKSGDPEKKYARVYEYYPADKDMVDAFSDIDQYYEGRE